MNINWRFWLYICILMDVMNQHTVTKIKMQCENITHIWSPPSEAFIFRPLAQSKHSFMLISIYVVDFKALTWWCNMIPQGKEYYTDYIKSNSVCLHSFPEVLKCCWCTYSFTYCQHYPISSLVYSPDKDAQGRYQTLLQSDCIKKCHEITWLM